MLNRIAEPLATLLRKAANNDKRIQAAIFLAIVSPVVLIACFAYVRTYQDLTEAALARRQSIAKLAATALQQRFDRLTDIGVSLATRVLFRQLVSEGKWLDAIKILQSVPRDFRFIDRVFLTDPAGTLMADTPALLGVRGKNFASRDWYRSVSRHWKPYISEVYQRAAEPRYNVVAAAIPINAEKETVVGILVLQVQLNGLVEWSNDIDVGPSGFVYLIDKKGQLATHPGRPSQGAIVNYAGLPVVQKALLGQTGVETMVNPMEGEERIAAYAPVAGIGWGVIATEPTRSAFAPRNQNLQRLMVLYGLIFLLSCALAYAILRTVTSLKRAEEKIQALNEELQRRASELETTNKELEAFSYSVSHDLRAPLRSIDGFSQALLEDYGDKLDAQASDYLQRVCVATRRMGNLIDDLLNLSRVARSEIKSDPVDLTALAQAIASELKNAEPERQVEFVIGKGISVNGDRRLLRIALENLLGNAWKFTAKHPTARIEFGATGDDGKRAYFVRDDGAGFEMAYAHKLFGAFQRLHALTEFTGTGIGLATVQRIVHRHSGRVWAEGKVEQGATFYFTLKP